MQATDTQRSIRDRLDALTDAQVAEFLGITVHTLKNRRSSGNAPLSAKVGRERLTQLSDLKRWLATRRGR